MIGKCKAVGGSSAGIIYLFQDKQDPTKERGYELDRNMLIGETPNSIISELKEWNNDNAKELKNQVFSMVLAPAGEDGKKLSDAQLLQLSKEFVANTLNVDIIKTPYYMRIHDDTKNKHVHIYLPRTDQNGKTISDKYCQYRAIDTADELAKKYSLTRAKEIQQDKIEKLDIDKKELKNTVSNALHNSTSFADFRKKLADKGVQINTTINKQGNVQGYRLKNEKADFKASEINRNITLSKIDTVFEQNAQRIAQEQRQTRKIGIRR